MSEHKSEKYLAEIDIRGLSPEFLKELESRLSARGASPEEAINTLRAQLAGVLQTHAAYVLVGSEFSLFEKELISVMREKGPQDPMVKGMYEQWVIDQENIIEKSDTRESRIAFERRRAVIFWNGGLQEFALEAWEDALIIAGQEGKNDLYDTIIEEMRDFLED